MTGIRSNVIINLLLIAQASAKEIQNNSGSMEIEWHADDPADPYPDLNDDPVDDCPSPGSDGRNDDSTERKFGDQVIRKFGRRKP